MMDREALAARLSELPLYTFEFIDPKKLEFTERIRWSCEHECPMYNKTWACPPAVGSVSACKAKCNAFSGCLLISTIVEVADISDIEETLATRPDHEAVTEQVAELMKQSGARETYILSTEACAVCERCAILDGQPCRLPERMHPCVESQGIVISELAEKHGIAFLYGGNIVTWFSLILYND